MSSLHVPSFELFPVQSLILHRYTFFGSSHVEFYTILVQNLVHWFVNFFRSVSIQVRDWISGSNSGVCGNTLDPRKSIGKMGLPCPLPRSVEINEDGVIIPWQELIFYHRCTLKVHFWESFPCRLLHNTSTTFILGSCRPFSVTRNRGQRLDFGVQ